MGVWSLDIQTGTITLDEGGANILGYEDPATPRPLEEWLARVHPDDVAHVKATLQAHLNGRTPVYEAQHRIRSRSGDWRWILNRGKVTHHDGAGKAWRAKGTYLDITPQKQLEEQLHETQKMQAIGQLAGGIAHDFNNLLTGILGFAAILRDEMEPGSEHHEAAATIEHAAQRAAALTNQLLGFARKGSYRKTAVPMHSVIEEVMGLLSRTVAPTVRMHTEFRAERDAILGDPSQMHQIILNLAMNAVDAMPEGGRLVFASELRILTDADCANLPDLSPGPHLVISVNDTGCGMTPEVVEHAFEPFFTTKPKGKGTGMGLSMVYGIVHGHHGDITIESRVGHGSTFSVFLPLAARKKESPDPTPAPLPTSGIGAILVVDDEEIVRSVLTTMLQRMGYTVLTAGSGEEALAVYRAHGHSVDLAIIDMIMPGMDGEATFDALKAIDPHIKVILSTGYDPKRQGAPACRQRHGGIHQEAVQHEGDGRDHRPAPVRIAAWSCARGRCETRTQ